MSAVCSICTHPDRQEIDNSVLAGLHSIARIAAMYGVEDGCLRRHRDNHLAADLAAAYAGRITSLRERLDETWHCLRIGLHDSADTGDTEGLVAVAEQVHRNAELWGQMTGELTQAKSETNIAVVFDSPRSLAEPQTVDALPDHTPVKGVLPDSTT